jgi:transposase
MGSTRSANAARRRGCSRRYETAQKRPWWFCQTCGFRIHPLKGTIFERSSTSLHLWFYAMYLITSTRCGISAKHLERELGVTYKTAWRTFNKIRNPLMNEDHEPLAGEVEADEMFVGGKLRESERRTLRAQGIANRGPASKKRAVTCGAVERGGRVRTTIIGRSRNAAAVSRALCEFVLPETMVFTDDWGGYDPLNREARFRHRCINHSARVYVDGNVHTQTIEGFFGLFKTGVRGAHPSVSYNWLQGYLNEWTWRYNRRERNAGRADVLRPAERSREQAGLGLLGGPYELPQRTQHVHALRHGDLESLGRLLRRLLSLVGHSW